MHLTATTPRRVPSHASRRPVTCGSLDPRGLPKRTSKIWVCLTSGRQPQVPRGYKRTMGCSAPAPAAKSKAVSLSSLFAPRLAGNLTNPSSGASASNQIGGSGYAPTPGIQALLLKRPLAGVRPSWMAPLPSVSFDCVPALQVLSRELRFAPLHPMMLLD